MELRQQRTPGNLQYTWGSKELKLHALVLSKMCGKTTALNESESVIIKSYLDPFLKEWSHKKVTKWNRK